MSKVKRFRAIVEYEAGGNDYKPSLVSERGAVTKEVLARSDAFGDPIRILKVRVEVAK